MFVLQIVVVVVLVIIISSRHIFFIYQILLCVSILCAHVFPDMLLSEVEAIMDSEATGSVPVSVEDPSDDSPPVKQLMSRYEEFKRRNVAQDSLITTQINKYLDYINDCATDDALVFWAKNHDWFPLLHNIALKVLSVPASSAPVESVFSRGGIIMRPHCACLDLTSNDTLQQCFFSLKLI